MSSPFGSINDASYQDGNIDFQSFDGTTDDSEAIPRRVMRVKVLYTFDNDNKTHCLARLVRPVPIQVVALDESTEIGVVELRTCIQAIVAASPEMIAKLENDYTVYAYDYSEYETPLVGQGMLSWVLATASPTPTAPARDSGTMVTGRVCKNIMGLFASGGIKETLEVKLKLVPVPTRSKREYLQSMAVYRDAGVVMPDGFDNSAWNSFLQAIPDAGALRDGSAGQGEAVGNGRANRGGVEQLHDLLTPKYGPEDDMYSQAAGSSRAGSPTPSQRSMAGHSNMYGGSRPASRASFHQPQPSMGESAIDDNGFEDGREKKRARLMQTDWHGRGSFGGNADSLRSAVTTAASIRNFRPSAVGQSSAGGDMIPRAPTPRPGEKRTGRPGMARVGSSLRRESLGGQSSYSMPEADLLRNDSGIYSADYDAGSSRHGSPSPDLPSSPPEYTPIEPPSSPLPELPAGPDSGFQSDLPLPSDAPAKSSNMKPPMNSHLARKAKGIIEWTNMQPGPRENLPTQSFPRSESRSHEKALNAQMISKDPALSIQAQPREPSQSRQPSTTPNPGESMSPSMYQPMPSIEGSFPPTPAETGDFGIPPPRYNPQQQYPQQYQQAPPKLNRANTLATAAPAPQPQQYGGQTIAPNGPATTQYVLEPRKIDGASQAPGQKHGRAPRRALKKAQSWTAGPGMDSSDVDSDGGLGAIKRNMGGSRSKGGSGAVRAASIFNQLEHAVATGIAPKHCCNCGEIKTPTWRPYWLKTFEGSGEGIETGGATGCHMVEPIEIDPNDPTKVTKYRMYKQYGHLNNNERTDGTWAQAYFCNPCGDYIRKYGKIRPRELFDPAMVQARQKKPGRRKKRTAVDQLTSDMPMPSSEWDLPTPYADMGMFTDPFGPSEVGFDMPQSEMGGFDGHMHPHPPQQVPLNDMGEQRAQDFDALQKAIQSSPARILAQTPLHNPATGTSYPADDAPAEPTTNADGEVITPKPTRRLLFPSPRKEGEFKSLETQSSAAKASANSSEGNTSQPSKKTSPGSNSSTHQHSAQEQPQHRQTSTAGDRTSVPQQSTSTATTSQQKKMPTSAPSSLEMETTLAADRRMSGEVEVDKENLPPAVNDDDEFAHLFEEGIFQTPGRKTPSKAVPRTPNSKSRNLFSTGLTPQTSRTGSKRSAGEMGPPDTPTPSKMMRRSPRLAEKNGGAIKEMTPFTKSLNLFLSDGLTSSPSKAFNWTLTSSPAKNLSSTFGDMAAISRAGTAAAANKAVQNLQSDDNLWSDFPMPSSPPFFSQAKGMQEEIGEYDWTAFSENIGIDVNVWEDGTATEGMKGWDDVFTDAIEPPAEEKVVVDATVTEMSS